VGRAVHGGGGSSRYVRVVLAAEESGANAALLGECRRFEDVLGLSPLALRRLGWAIASNEPEQPEEEAVARRQRMRAVDLSDPDAS
jgi:hypothetical protein